MTVLKSSRATPRRAALAALWAMPMIFAPFAGSASAATTDHFTCRASALRVNGVALLPAPDAEPAVANRGADPCVSGQATADTAPSSLALLAGITTGGVSATTAVSTASGSAGSSVANAMVLGALGVSATSVSSAADYTCVGATPVPSATSKVTDLRIAGGPRITSNQAATLADGSLAEVKLNQTTTTPGSITQQAVRITVLNGTNAGAQIVLGESQAGITGNPCATVAGSGTSVGLGGGITGGGSVPILGGGPASGGSGAASSPDSGSNAPGPSGGSGSAGAPIAGASGLRIIRYPPRRTASPNATFIYSARADDTLECRLDSGPFQACSGRTVLRNLGLGSHTFSVRALRDGLVVGSVSYRWKVVRGCPSATGAVTARAIGALRLGMTRRRARDAYRYSAVRAKGAQDVFCLRGSGVRVEYASAGLMGALSPSQRRRITGRAVLMLTANGHYSVDGVRPRARFDVARAQLGRGSAFRIGRNLWFAHPHGSRTDVLRIQGGTVLDVGIADAAITQTAAAQRRLVVNLR